MGGSGDFQAKVRSASKAAVCRRSRPPRLAAGVLIILTTQSSEQRSPREGAGWVSSRAGSSPGWGRRATQTEESGWGGGAERQTEASEWRQPGGGEADGHLICARHWAAGPHSKAGNALVWCPVSLGKLRLRVGSHPIRTRGFVWGWERAGMELGMEAGVWGGNVWSGSSGDWDFHPASPGPHSWGFLDRGRKQEADPPPPRPGLICLVRPHCVSSWAPVCLSENGKRPWTLP